MHFSESDKQSVALEGAYNYKDARTAHTSDETHRVVDHVDTLAPGDLEHLLLPTLLRVVHTVVSAAQLDRHVYLRL